LKTEKETADLTSDEMLFQRQGPLIDKDSLLMLDKAELMCRAQEVLV